MSHEPQARQDHDAIQRVQVQIHRQVTHTHFALGTVQPTEDGGRLVTFMCGNGDLLVFPLSADSAKELGTALLAPSLQAAGPAQMPNGGPA